MAQHASDKRVFSRAPCQSEALQADTGVLLGEMTDVGLQGAFISTPEPLPLHAVLSVRFGLSGRQLLADAEVVRTQDNGMGLRFLGQSRSHQKALKMYVLAAVGNMAYRDVLTQLHDSGSSITEPIEGKEKIGRLLHQSRDANFLILSKHSPERHRASLYHQTDEFIGLLCDRACPLEEGQECFVLHTKDWESYSFRSVVRRVTGMLCEIEIPTQLLYSERRSTSRKQLPNAVFTYSPDGKSAKECELLDVSEQGLSIKVSGQDHSLWPGVLLPNSVIFDDGKRQTLANAVVQNVTRVQHGGEEWYRVGLSHGNAAAPLEDSYRPLNLPGPDRGLRGRITSRLKQAVNGAVYLLHDKVLPRLPGPREAFSVLDLTNDGGKPVVGLLNTSWKQTTSRVKSTVVIVTPGLCGRKESMGALAYMLLDAFEREGRNVAVLRYDGVNNVGESYKEKGCALEGKETLFYNFSDCIDDVVGVYNWVQSNPILDPTDVIIVSVSVSAVATRHALAQRHLEQVSLWIPFMGAADAANAITNSSGNIDCYRNFKNGIKNGQVPIMGSMIDGEHFCTDMESLGVATLEDAKRDMAAIDVDVMWMVGTHDAYMDPGRARQIMKVPSKRRREVIEVNAGHLPQSGEEAIAEFSIICDAILKHVGVEEPSKELPSPGWLLAMTEREWRRVKKSSGASDRSRWWANHLKPAEGVGEILQFSQGYKDLIKLQARMVPKEAETIVDLGCGWGALSEMLVSRPDVHVTACDFSEAPLKHLRESCKNSRLDIKRQSIDSNIAIGVRRWVQGEVPDLGAAISQLPINRQKEILRLAGLNDGRIHTAMRGSQVDCKLIAEQLDLKEGTLEALWDFHYLARYVTGKISRPELLRSVSSTMKDSLRDADLLSFPANSVDCVTCSLVLNFLQSPEAALSECYRILKPSGSLIVSVYQQDADMSEIMRKLIGTLEDSKQRLPYPRNLLLDAARAQYNFFEHMRHLEEEGSFRKYTAESVAMELGQAGFAGIKTELAFGEPAHVIVATGTKE